ncbi:hypothetical protein CDO44_07270 [Pigmentiphaga sp. NML080357]|uniref:Bug family tripartite tricarboxylate transporter substrate binding protein n=1 Tax=Pigmentiphaga sp. NML080357 TaxID=2008675 RepID=UPI000B41190A|nr:tripartite tricarboxylate transporter substrate binding protein [Pigmentiphaga sp. NML080357]OVZ61009.1 hypothetical protein CDO44_07270 [Pigmentiphaga sp. NML080357]
MKIATISLACSLLCATSLAPASAQTQPYPVRPVTIVTGFPPGGISDVLARALAARLSVQMGQSVIVENRPGAGTTIASAYVAKAAPDGYTLLFQDMTTHAINAEAYKRLPFDALNDFSLISLVASTPLMMVSSLGSKAGDVKSLVELAKKKQSQVSYASSGNGTIMHLAGESFKQAMGIDSLHVPYKGGAPSVQAVVAGEVTYSFLSMPPAVAQAKAGKIHALAVTTAKRVAAMPDVPTFKEQGIPLEIVLYSGLIGPKGMPPAVVSRLNEEVRKALESPEMKQTLANAGADALASTPAEFDRLLKSQATAMAQAVKLANVTLD